MSAIHLVDTQKTQTKQIMGNQQNGVQTFNSILKRVIIFVNSNVGKRPVHLNFLEDASICR